MVSSRRNYDHRVNAWLGVRSICCGRYCIDIDGPKLVTAGHQAPLEEWHSLLRSLKPELLEMMVHGATTVQRRAAAFFTRGMDAGSANTLALATRDS
jgi:hypothetical protein